MAAKSKSSAILRSLACASALALLASCASRQAENVAVSEGDAMVQLGDRMLAEGQAQAALQMYRRGGGSAARIGAGRALQAVGKPLEALAAYRAAGYGQKQAALGAGGILLGLGRVAEASAAYEAGLRANPGDGELLGGRALALDAAGDHAAALEQFRAALAADPGSHKLQNNYGLALAIGGEYDAAYDRLENLVRDPASGQAERQTLALAYALGGRFDAAERLASADMGATDLAENLAHYRELQTMSTGGRLAAILGAPITQRQTPETVAIAAAPLALPAAEQGPQYRAALLAMRGPILATLPVASRPLAEPTAMAGRLPAPSLSQSMPRPVPAKQVSSAADGAKTGWAVQLAALRHDAELIPSWERLNEKYADLLGGLSLRSTKIDLGDRPGKSSGVFYRLTAAALPDRAQALTLCEQLRARGQDCIVRGPGQDDGSVIAQASPAKPSARTSASGTSAPAKAKIQSAATESRAVKWTLVSATGGGMGGDAPANTGTGLVGLGQTAPVAAPSSGPLRNDGSGPAGFAEGEAH